MYIMCCWLSLAYLFIFVLSNGLRFILDGYYKPFDKFVSVYNYFGYLLPTVIFILNSFCFRGGIMKIFGIICMSIMLGIAFVDMVAVFYNLTNDFFSSLFMCYDYRNYYSSLRKGKLKWYYLFRYICGFQLLLLL